VALHTNPEIDAEVERFFVREPELTGKLVDADLLRQLGGSVLSDFLGALCWAPDQARALILAHQRAPRYRPYADLLAAMMCPSVLAAGPLLPVQDECPDQALGGRLGDVTAQRPRDRPLARRDLEATRRAVGTDPGAPALE
jgi:hypothetical protein